MEIKEIPIKNILIKKNFRKNIEETDLDEMMQSIKQHGQKLPIDVRPLGKNRYEFISGFRRLRACEKLGHTTVKAMISHDVDDKKLTILNLTENMQRKDPSFAELGRGIDELMREYKMDHAQIAVRLGVKKPYVQSIMATYNGIPEKHRKDVKFMSKGSTKKEGAVSHTVAANIAIIRKELSLDNENLDKLFDYAKKHEPSSEKIRILAIFLSQGADMETAIKKVDEYHVYTAQLIAPISLMQRLMQEHKCQSSGLLIRKIIYGLLPSLPKPEFIKFKKEEPA